MTARVGRAGSRPARTPRPAVAAVRTTVPELLRRLGAEGFPPTGAVVLGGGCAGLALGVALAGNGGAVAVVEARTGDRDGRTWCSWDTGDALLPEAASHSWDRWEIRTAGGRAVSSDAAHSYRMVRAQDYRAAARARISAGPHGRLLDGVRVTAGADGSTADVGSTLFDARGAAPAGPVAPGRVLLHQRFVGRWIRTARPVFDDRTVTLMDFPEQRTGDVRFFYVLPVAPDLAMVECTVFARTAHGTEPFRRHIADYLRDRWALGPDDWSVEGEEAGSIPMTDARPSPSRAMGHPFGLRAGIARPSTGYAFTRIQIAARRTAAALATGAAVPVARDPLRTRALDAVFLRFLRDQPQRAPEVFLRMFDRLPGPLTVRFLTERSTLLDDLRLVLALPKAPFLRAAATTAVERLRRDSP